jgi:hypothetical protein
VTKRTTRILIDLSALLLFPFLYNKRPLGLAFHEVAGLVLLGLVGIHLVFNWKWIAGVTTRFFKRNLPAKTRLTYLLNALLGMFFAMTVTSGILISRVIFTGFRNPVLRNLHFFSAGVTLLLFGIHFGLHLGFFAAAFKKLTYIPSKIARPLSIAVLVAIVLFGFYSISSSNLPRWLSLPFTADLAEREHTSGPEKAWALQPSVDRNNQRQSFDSAKTGLGSYFHFSVDNLKAAAMSFLTYISIVMVLGIPTYFLTRYTLRHK